MESLYNQMKTDYLSSTEDDDEVRRNYRTFFLRAVEEHCLLRPSEAKGSSRHDLISHINASLASRGKRSEGMCLLRLALRQSSSDVFIENYDHWSSVLMKAVETELDATLHKQACDVFSEFVRVVMAFPELSRNFMTSTLPSLLSALLDGKSKIAVTRSKAVLDVLSCVVQNVASSCGPFRCRIENYAVNYLSHSSDEMRQSAGLCLASCSRIGVGTGKNAQGSKQMESWTLSADRFLWSLHSVLDQAYADLEPETFVPSEHLAEQTALFTAVSDVEPMRTCLLARQFDGLSTCLCALLEQEFPAVVKLPAVDILDLVCRTLTMQPKFLCTRPVPDRLRVLSVLPFLHDAALRVLKGLVTAGRKGLVPYANNICQLLIQSLQAWTSNSAAEQKSDGSQPYRMIRCSVYSAASTWLRELGVLSGFSLSSCSGLVQQILSDICVKRVLIPTAVKSKSKLDSVDNSGTGKKRKRSSAIEYNSKTDSARILSSRRTDVDNCKDVCVAALKTLRSLLLACSGCIPRRPYLSIIDNCVPLLTDIQSHGSLGTIPSPYDDVKCRHELYEVMKAVILCPSKDTVAPISIVAKLFSSGLNDTSLDVRMCCRESLAVCESLIHPRAGALVRVATFSSAACDSSLQLDAGRVGETSGEKSDWMTARSLVDEEMEVESNNDVDNLDETTAAHADVTDEGDVDSRTSTSVTSIVAKQSDSIQNNGTIIPRSSSAIVDSDEDDTIRKRNKISDVETGYNAGSSVCSSDDVCEKSYGRETEATLVNSCESSCAEPSVPLAAVSVQLSSAVPAAASSLDSSRSAALELMLQSFVAEDDSD